MTIYHTVDIDVADIAKLIQERFKGTENQASEFRITGVTEYSTHLAGVRTYVTSTKPLVLEILLPSVSEPSWPDPGPDRELDTVDPFLK